MIEDFSSFHKIVLPTLRQLFTICCHPQRKSTLKTYFNVHKKGSKMIEKDFDLLRIIKQMRVSALQLRCLMDQSQASLSKQLAKHALSDDSSFSSSVSDSETSKSYEFLDKIFGDTEEKITKRLLKIFLSRNSKLKMKLQSESANVMEYKV